MSVPTSASTVRCAAGRLDRRAEELTVVRPLPDRVPDVDRRWVIRIAPDPYVRVDTCDYSLDPRLVGRRVELRVSQRELLKAPAAARPLPKLAERARQQQWSYERFAEALLATEVVSRDGHGGESRIKQARFPARKRPVAAQRRGSVFNRP
jgi:Mu transposase, C-terminal domain